MRTLTLILFFLSLTAGLLAQDRWLRKRASALQDEALDLDAFTSGHYLVGGFFGQSIACGNTTLQSAGQSDAYLEKIAADGSTIWAKRFGGSLSDRITAVAAGADGSSYAIGLFTGTATFDSYELTAIGDSLDIFILKVANNGEVEWVNQCGGLGNDYPHGIDVNASGEVVACGNFRYSANFGTTVLTATNYPGTLLSSFDSFLARLNSNGQWISTKHIESTYDVSAFDAVITNDGTVHAIGQFSQSVTIDQTHTTFVDQAGFIVSLNSDNSESWFLTMNGAQVSGYDLELAPGGDLLASGNFRGQLALNSVFGVQLVPSDYLQNAFLIRLTAEGFPVWTHILGSDNEITARKSAIGPAGEIYQVGMFGCVLSELEDELGEGYFHSAGFRDVFIVRCTPDGTRAWQRQFGGPGNDLCWGIGCTISDQPRIAGGFKKFFSAPNQGSFQYLSDNEVEDDDTFLDDYYYSPNENTSCGGWIYGSYRSIQGIGAQDIFIANPVDLNAPIYDIYALSGTQLNCDRSPFLPLISIDQGESGYREALQSIEVCGESQVIYFHSNTGTNNYIGPEYNWIWNDGSSQDDLQVYESGVVWLSGQRTDGCAAFSDSVYIELIPFECQPVLIDGVDPSPNCFASAGFCAPAEYTLSTELDLGYTAFWITSDGTSIDAIEPYIVGDNQPPYLEWISPDGCVGHTDVEVQVVTPLDSIMPQFFIEFEDIILNEGDSINVCSGETLSLFLIDAYGQTNFDQLTSILGTIDDVPFLSQNAHATYYPSISGWHLFEASGFLHNTSICPDQDTVFAGLYSIYINLIPTPESWVSVLGNNMVCPGETTSVLIESNGTLTWSGNGMSGAGNGMWDLPAGQYSAFSSLTINGCTSQIYAPFQVPTKPNPIATSDPNPPIVCPGQTVTLSVTPGISYEWIGPLGGVVSTDQSFEVSVIGYYFCRVTDEDGCVLESNFIETLEFTSPELLVYPSTDLCSQSSVSLQLINVESATWQWLAPLSGSFANQIVTEPGEYGVELQYCGNSYSQYVTITDTPTPSSIEASAPEVCTNSPVTLSGNPGMAGYLWQPGNLTTPIISVNEPGIYTLTTFNVSGCQGISSIELLPVFVESVSGESAYSACYGSDIELQAQASGEVVWSNQESGSPVLFIGSDFVWTNAVQDAVLYAFNQDNLCLSEPLLITVTIDEFSFPPAVSSSENACLGGIWWISALAEGTNQYFWQTPGGIQSSGAFLEISPVSGEDAGVYELIVENENCGLNSYLFPYTPLSPPIGNLTVSPDSAFCIGSEVIMTIVDFDTAPLIGWILPSGAFYDGAALWIDSLSFTDGGVYQAVVSGLACNPVFSEVVLDVNPPPFFDLTEESFFCEESILYIQGPDEMNHYIWSTENTESYISVGDSGWYWLTVTDNFGCSYTDSIHVTNPDCPEMEVNIFTPNGDGKNDYLDFYIYGTDVTSVSIFNRWGTEIQRLEAPNLKWYGHTTTSDRLEEGTYYFVLTRSSPAKNRPKNRGSVMLLR